MIDHSANAGRAPLKEHRGDCYDSPPEAVHALLRVEKLEGIIWEPAAGIGAIAITLREAGYKVYATDLNDRGCPDCQNRVDFLLETGAPTHIGAVVTNPPFALAGEFIAKAIMLGVPKVAMLLRLAFLESEKRSSILDGGLLARVYVFKNRLPFMHRAGWAGPRATSSIPFAWMIWEIGHKGPAALSRISWEP